MIFASLMTLKVKNKTWISNFQVRMQAETNLPAKFMLKIFSSASTEKSCKPFLNVENCSEFNSAWARFLFSFFFFFLMFLHMQLTVFMPCVSFAERSCELRGRLPDRPCKHQRCTLQHRRMHVTGGSFAIRVPQTIET